MARGALYLLTGMLIGAALVALTACTPSPDAPLPSLVTRAEAAEYDAAPLAARQYRRELTGNARAVWGMEAPIAMFGGQVEQESGWRPDARSPYAGGLAQFTPATAEWIGTAYAELADPQPFNPSWALRALVRYDRHLYDRASGATDCDRHAFALVGYNGGEGWRKRDQALALQRGLDDQRYFGHVETVNAGRAPAFFAENRGYVPGILKRQPKYLAWGTGVCMERAA